MQHYSAAFNHVLAESDRWGAPGPHDSDSLVLSTGGELAADRRVGTVQISQLASVVILANQAGSYLRFQISLI
jgi:hypothetical protein